MRVYVHYEEREPLHTLALRWDEAHEGTLDHALELFVAEYNAKHPEHALARDDLGVYDAGGLALPGAHRLMARVRDAADLFVKARDDSTEPVQPRVGASDGALVSHAPAPSASAVSAASASASSGATSATAAEGSAEPASSRTASTVAAPPGPSAAAATAAPPPADDGRARQLKAHALEGERAFKGKQYRAAREAFLKVVEHNPRHRAALSRLAEIETYCERHASAVALLETACDAARSAAASSSTTPLLLSRLGDAHLGLGHAAEAVRAYREALELCPEGEGGAPGATRRERLMVKLGRALYASGERKGGADVFMGVLQRTDNELPEALQEYAAVALDCGQLEDSLKVYLRLVAKRSSDKDVRAGLGRALAADTTGSELLAQLPPTAASAPAYAFLATVAKDNSHLAAAERLYRVATQHAPSSASYALNLMHVLELELEYDKALDVLAAFLRAQDAARAVGGDGLTCGAALRALEGSGALRAAPELEGAAGAADDDGLPPPPPLLERAGEDLPKSGPLSAEGAAGEAAVAARLGGAEALGGLGGGAPDEASTGASGYSAAELDLLGLLLTAVKICYVQGKLRALPALVNLIEPARAGRQLHTSFVRNEHAYYCCVAQLLPHHGWPALRLPAHERVVHVLGDSHCLSHGWQRVTLGGRGALLRPVLVTGLKAWHLRPQSTFFPKANFENAAATLPKGATAVVLFGEIDCRESLLLCVERARYESIEEGARVVIDIYVNALLELARSRSLARVCVHPVPPVLNETRAVVCLFNGLLRKRVRARAGWLRACELCSAPHLASDPRAPPPSHARSSVQARRSSGLKGSTTRCWAIRREATSPRSPQTSRSTARTCTRAAPSCLRRQWSAVG